MAEQLFVFIQMEFPWVLGPAEGRYLLRGGEEGEAEHVVVIGTLSAGRASGHPSPGMAPRTTLRARWVRRRGRPASAEPAAVSTTRATVIDPVPVSAEHQARAWLGGLDREREVTATTAVLNRVIHDHRIATADPYLSEVSPSQALVIRAGWGEGEEVADGDWSHARELPWPPAPRRGSPSRRRRDRSTVLRPQERLAALLGGRSRALLCEELALRARLDLDQGRLVHAAIELDGAYAAALAELRRENRQDLAIRIAELQQLHPQVATQAGTALEETPDGDVLEHALGRLEATLRARTAGGFSLG